MSLSINVERVTAVLIGPEWHMVDQGTFVIDDYEFIDRQNETSYGGGLNRIYETGFMFQSSGSTICGPMRSIVALRVL